MRIGMDLRYTSAAGMGTGSYAQVMCEHLASAVHRDDTILAFGHALQAPLCLPSGVQYVPVLIAKEGHRSYLEERLVWDSQIEAHKLDVFFSPTGIAPIIKTCPIVLTIHDLLFEIEPRHFNPSLLNLLKSEIPRSIKAADAIVSVSEVTKQQLLDIYGVPEQKVFVLHQPLRTTFKKRPARKAIEAFKVTHGILKPYILLFSNHSPHKNSKFALELYAQWRSQARAPNHILLIAGGGRSPQSPIDLQALADFLGITAHVRVLGYVSESDLPALYAGASLFLFPSLHEGWGLPPLESVAVGTPALVSDRGALPEAIGDAGYVLPLNEPKQWITKIDEILDGHMDKSIEMGMKQRRKEYFKPVGADLFHILKNSFYDKRHSKVRGSSFSLSGCMVIRDGCKLGYPFVEAATAIAPYVDELIIVDGQSDDGTWDVLSRMSKESDKLKLYREPWPAIRTGGEVIASATNSALLKCEGSHILCVQADEIFTDATLQRLVQLLRRGYQSACFPYLHFRGSWRKVIRNPDYKATIRCVPNSPKIRSVGDGCTFSGPLSPCIAPEEFPEPVFHVGWVFRENQLMKHINHSQIYTDHSAYQEKAKIAHQVLTTGHSETLIESIDPQYVLEPFSGHFPKVLCHLLDLPKYDPAYGLELWKAACCGTPLQAYNGSSAS